MLNYKVIEILNMPDMVKLYIETFNAKPWNDHWTKETAEKRLHQMICVEDFHGLCAYKENELCGLILGCSEQFYDGVLFNIREFCVKNGLRGKGIGTEIFNHMQAELKKKGINKIILYTSRGDFTEHFYKKQGFRNLENLTLMEKDI